MYNWQSAATPQGRERLKKLMDSGKGVILSTWPMSLYALTLEDGEYSVLGFGSFGTLDEIIIILKGLQFLDPSPQQPDDAPEGYHVVTFAKDQHPDENGLMPCPFCGGKAQGICEKGGTAWGSDGFWVHCADCLSRIPMKDSELIAIESWNKRA